MNTSQHDSIRALQTNLSRVIHGKEEHIELIVVALLAGGSILLEDVPGVGKTTLAKALAKSVDCHYSRIQFTPDLLPGDILGSSIYNPVTGSFSFHRGPIFCNVLLADEINRASPRTQSALLEAMSEMQTTIEGTRYALDPPFLVVATQNPVEFHGTYPLPEAQLDRFLVSLTLGYPGGDAEVEMLRSQALLHPLETLQAVMSKETVLALQAAVRQIHVDDSIVRYIVALAGASRTDARLKLGVSPRGTGMLYRAAQALALMNQRDHVLPDDVQRLSGAVLAHRVMLTSKAKYGGQTKAEIVREITGSVKVPS